jgi:hypothetical protein
MGGTLGAVAIGTSAHPDLPADVQEFSDEQQGQSTSAYNSNWRDLASLIVRVVGPGTLGQGLK